MCDAANPGRVALTLLELVMYLLSGNSSAGAKLDAKMLGDILTDVGEEAADEADDDSDLMPMPPSLRRQVSQTVRTTAEVAEDLVERVLHVASVLQVPASIAALLLRRVGWNEGDAMDRFMENPVKLLQSCGLDCSAGDEHFHAIAERLRSMPASCPRLQGLGVGGQQGNGAAESDGCEEEEECLICLDEVPRSQTAALCCGHRFCISCWQDAMSSAAEDGILRMMDLECPEDECKVQVDMLFWRHFATPNVYARFQQMLLKLVIDESPTMARCPDPASAGCTRVVQYSGTRPDVLCDCGVRYVRPYTQSSASRTAVDTAGGNRSMKISPIPSLHKFSLFKFTEPHVWCNGGDTCASAGFALPAVWRLMVRPRVQSI